jgi:hypothetical protein
LLTTFQSVHTFIERAYRGVTLSRSIDLEIETNLSLYSPVSGLV